MVTFAKIQEYMRALAAEDGKTRFIQASGDSLEEALQQASIELGAPVKSLEYEVLERGSRGSFGLGRRKWIIIASEAKKKEAAGLAAEENLDFDFGFETGKRANSADRDGEVGVRFNPEGVMLKVSSPKGKGKKVSEREALEAIARRYDGRIDAAQVSRVVKHADGEFIKIADYQHNPAHDATMTVDIVDFEMRALLTISEPGVGGADPAPDGITAFLESNGVVFGLDQDAILALSDNPRYKTPIPIAEGQKPVMGADARIVYNFELDKSKVKLKENRQGKVDFKELNLIQNVVEGQVIAKKISAQEGQPGTTVTGKSLPAKDGLDVEIGVGKNVKLSEDGSAAIAEINGQVIITGDKINVEPIYTVDGDVNPKTGNILFLGTVVVKGSVEDGFSVKAAGNIEVLGSVGRSELDAEGDIIVHQGITGKSGGKVSCAHSVWSKFIENAYVEAGELVVVSDGIINSQVFANKKVICKGKRASIVGGHVRASEEINAKTLGSVASSETICEVGYDPKSKEKLEQNDQRRDEISKLLEDINVNVATIENMKKARRTIPEEKLKSYEEMLKKKMQLIGEMKVIDEEMENLKTYLSQLKLTGRISCAGIVFPGVKIIIKDTSLDIRNEAKSVTYFLENSLIRVTRYEESDEDITRKA